MQLSLVHEDTLHTAHDARLMLDAATPFTGFVCSDEPQLQIGFVEAGWPRGPQMSWDADGIHQWYASRPTSESHGPEWLWYPSGQPRRDTWHHGHLVIRDRRWAEDGTLLGDDALSTADAERLNQLVRRNPVAGLWIPDGGDGLAPHPYNPRLFGIAPLPSALLAPTDTDDLRRLSSSLLAQWHRPTLALSGTDRDVSATLASRLAARPDDADAWQVLADFLASRDDPRGEAMIHLGRLLDDVPVDDALRSAHVLTPLSDWRLPIAEAAWHRGDRAGLDRCLAELGVRLPEATQRTLERRLRQVNRLCPDAPLTLGQVLAAVHRQCTTQASPMATATPTRLGAGPRVARAAQCLAVRMDARTLGIAVVPTEPEASPDQRLPGWVARCGSDRGTQPIEWMSRHSGHVLVRRCEPTILAGTLPIPEQTYGLYRARARLQTRTVARSSITGR
ncbi:MAG: hypothetical protein KTR31_34195 [Myxococcales bacterium]|nr:hypothetical protein [Myxococcales bacterium]